MEKFKSAIIRVMNLEVKLGKLKLKNPVVLASGTFDRSIIKNIDINNLGGIVTKTVTLKPREGNPLPHIIKTKYGFLNSVGLKNPGIKKYLSDELPFWQKFNTVVIPSIGGETIDEYINLAKILNKTSVEAIEVNVSCPNVVKGLVFGTDEKILKKLITLIRRNFDKSIIVKISPNVTDIASIAKSAVDGGADILSCTNTFYGLVIDNKTEKAKLHQIIGGYSGPAIKPIALASVWQVYKKLHCSIIGGGGITDFSDALDFIMCGATAISVGSAMYKDRSTPLKILNGFEDYCKNNNISNLNKLKGII